MYTVRIVRYLQVKFKNDTLSEAMSTHISNRPFYSYVLSDLAYECKRVQKGPCFDTGISAILN